MFLIYDFDISKFFIFAFNIIIVLFKKTKKMKSFWEKATNLGTKAKSFASVYLNTDKNPKATIEEQEKIFSENFLNLRKEIDEFKHETIKAAEEKIRGANNRVKTMEEILENEKRDLEQKVLELESAFCIKEKGYLIQITDNEKKGEEKDLALIKSQDIIQELNQKIKTRKIFYLLYNRFLLYFKAFENYLFFDCDLIMINIL